MSNGLLRKRRLPPGATLATLVLLSSAPVAARPAAPRQIALPQATALAFDVVTIRQNDLPAGPRYIRPIQGGRLEIRGMTLRDLIRFVYGPAKYPSPEQMVGGPPWLTAQRFDIDAVGKGDFMRSDPGSTGPPQALLRMMQDMLETRFKLKTRLGVQEQEHYVLTRAKPDALGPQLRPRASCVPPAPGVAPDPAQTCNIFTATAGVLTARAVVLDQLALNLGEFPSVARLVRNQTGLTGPYDMDVSWVPDLINLVPGGKPVPNPNAGTGPNLPAAFEQQLGLKLELRTGAVEVVFIDQVEMP
jgi:uncharacterized protein (TIGR03435 family)